MKEGETIISVSNPVLSDNAWSYSSVNTLKFQLQAIVYVENLF